jgi:hypothetical protein
VCAKEKGRCQGFKKLLIIISGHTHNSRQMVLDERRLCLSTAVSAANNNNLFPPISGVKALHKVILARQKKKSVSNDVIVAACLLAWLLCTHCGL